MGTLSSCVGTIEETGTPNTEAEGTAISPSAYAGIAGVKAISDTRVEIYFPPAPGDQKELIYQIFKDKSEQPIEVRFDALRKSYDGNLTFTYNGLSPSTTYAFSVEYKNLVTNRFSRSTKGTLNVTTFSNQMCDFNGIIDARNANGVASLDTINIYWFPAKDSGFIVSSEDYDPERYEIIGISEEDGGLDRIEDLNANRIVINVSSTKSYHPVSGLNPGTKYFFQVRCKHRGWKNKGYLDLEETKIGTYRRESNTRFIEIATKGNGSEPDFVGPFQIKNPLLPLDAESKLGVEWAPATGGFTEYRIFYHRLIEGPALSYGVYDEASMMADDKITDDLMDEIVGPGPGYPSGCNPANALCGSKRVPAEELSAIIENLDKFKYYQVKVVACVDSECLAEKRISLGSRLARVVPNMIPFNGITSIEDPNPTIDISRVTLRFDSPLRNSGYASRLVVRCFQGADDSTPVTFPEDGSAITGSGKSDCEGLSLNTTLPAHAGMLNFTAIEVDGVAANENRNYCFTVHPEIDESANGLDYVLTDADNAIIQCSSPTIKGPSYQEFRGRREDICEVDESDPANLKLKVKWHDPEGGFWEDFKVIWKEYDPTSDNPDIAGSFSFHKALAGDADYTIAEVGSKTDDEYTITTNLLPGRKYHVGVIPFFELDGVDQYGEFNTATRPCEIPYPQAEFNEWTSIVAIGPKVDGRVPEKMDNVTNKWYSTRLFETLDEAGVPIEVEMEQPKSLNPADPNKRGNTIFNGVFGKKDGNVNAEGPHRYSNSGIVRIEFKDVLIDHQGDDPSYYDDKDDFHELREFLVNGDTDKYSREQEGWNDGIVDPTEGSHRRDRKIGYKIFRSDDNQKTWVDLTMRHPDKNPFQRSDNEGLVYSDNVVYFKVNGTRRTEERRVTFTDYSVRYIEKDRGVTERGRVLFYKVVPYINGVALEYKNAEANPHYIARVVLPPPNMAFVSRLMANRQACIELGKESEIRKGAGEFYSCPYNGIGAKGMTKPWRTTETYMDMGGDLLVDRYELGCDWTRGDTTDGAPDSSLSDSEAGNSSVLFDIYKDFTEEEGISGGNPLKGCFQMGSQATNYDSFYSNDEPTNYGPDGGGETEFSASQAIPGDCFGGGTTKVALASLADCNLRAGLGGGVYIHSMEFPGAWSPFDYIIDNGSCRAPMTGTRWNQSPSLPYDNSSRIPQNSVQNMDPYAAHSEFGAVFHRRRREGGNIRQIGRYFASNTAEDGEDRYLQTRNDTGSATCSINLYGVNKEDGVSSVSGQNSDVRPRWLNLSELMSTMHVRDIARDGNGHPRGGTVLKTIDDLYSWSFNKLFNSAEMLYGGDWLPPQHIQAEEDKRFFRDMTIAQYMTSNASKLPQIGGLNQQQYGDLCKQFPVEVGYTDTAGNFVRTYPEGASQEPLKKRLPRRSEFVAFSAWPDRYGAATVVTLEYGRFKDDLSELLQALSSADKTETGTAFSVATPDPGEEQELVNALNDIYGNGACNTRYKNSGTGYAELNYYNVDLSKDGVERFRELHPAFPQGGKDNISSNFFFWAGSSRLDSTQLNTERCVSRYGVQDHIGNAREVGADKFWCDPEAHDFKLKFGSYSINLATNGFDYFRINSFPDWDDQISNKGVTYGECSIRANGNNTGDSPAASGNMVSIYTDFTKSDYNTGLLPRVNPVDPESVLYARNGADGAFLSFGENSVMPPLFVENDKWSNLNLRRGSDSDAGYFSPVLGMPVRCSSVSCLTSKDNMLVTSGVFHGNLRSSNFGKVIDSGRSCEDHLPGGSHEKDPEDFPIRQCRFPLGMSNIKNYSTHRFTTNYWTLQTAGEKGMSNYNVPDFYVGADANGPIRASDKPNIGLPVDGDLNADGDAEDPGETPDGVIDATEFNNWFATVDLIELTNTDPAYIELARITPYNNEIGGMFINGGSSRSADDEDRPGRYALDVTMNSAAAYTPYESSLRCVVKVYGDDY